jgi:hypothetical protein
MHALAQKPDVLKQVVDEALQKKRGREEEAAVLDSASKRHCAPIVARNESKIVQQEDEYLLIGVCDGILEDEECVVEVKKRRNWFRQPPEYDLIQLRVYMRLYDLPRGVLIEEQMNGPLRRETRMEDDQEEWQRIHQALTRTALEIRRATPHDIRAWAEATFRS